MLRGPELQPASAQNRPARWEGERSHCRLGTQDSVPNSLLILSKELPFRALILPSANFKNHGFFSPLPSSGYLIFLFTL